MNNLRLYMASSAEYIHFIPVVKKYLYDDCFELNWLKLEPVEYVRV